MKSFPETTAALRRLRNTLAERALVNGQARVLDAKREPDPFRRALLIHRAAIWNAIRQFIRPTHSIIEGGISHG